MEEIRAANANAVMDQKALICGFIRLHERNAALVTPRQIVAPGPLKCANPGSRISLMLQPDQKISQYK